MTIKEEANKLDNLREALTSAKRTGVFAQDSRLSLAASQTVDNLNRSLSSYDDDKEELRDEYQEEDEEGREIFVIAGVGDVVRTDDGFVHADSGETIDLNMLNRSVGYKMSDPEAYQEEIEHFGSQEIEVNIVPVSRDFFHEQNVWGEEADRNVDLVVLNDLWLYDEEEL